MNQLQKSAIRYAVVHGLHVHPLKPSDKTPATGNGLKDASNQDAQVTAWWTQNPQFNIGLNCGASGLVALDFDVIKPDFSGGDLLAQLLSDYPTVTSETQSGGYHLLYRQPESVKLGNSRGNLPTGVDVRGLGGYIVLPPSKLDPDLIDSNKPDTPERETKRNLYRQRPGYQWAKGKGIGEIEIAPLPAFVLDLIVKDDDEVSAKATTARTNSTDKPLDDVIGEFNHRTNIIALLESHGYTLAWRKGDKARMVRPGGNSASVMVFLDGDKPVSFHHSTSDALNSDHVRDAFDIYTHLAHGGTQAKAHEAAKRLQGKWVDSAKKVATAIVEAMVTSEPPPTEQNDQADNDINPLDVELVKGLKLGWIDDYTALFEALTSSPKEFHQLAGLLTVASVLQRRAWLPMSFGNIYPNLYGCIIAPSTVFGKSTSINAPRRVLQSAMMEKLLIPAQGSSEGLIKQLSLTPSALMIRDEIGTLFGSDRVKYLKDYKQDLTALYDCMPYSRRLSNEEIKVERPYLNILGATTPARFYGNVNRNDWMDGFMPRWLFVQPEGEPNFENMTGMFNHEEQISKLAWRLMEIDREKETPFKLQGNAFQMWQSWRTESLKLAWQQQDEVALAIIGRYATYALKFSIILAAINGDWATVNESTMQTAIHLADNYRHNVNRILSEREKHEISGGKLQKVFLLLQRKGGGDGMTMREITQLANMSKTEVEPVLEKLVALAAVVSADATTAKNRQIKKYYAVAKELPIKHYS